MSMRYPAAILSATYQPLKTPDAPTIGAATIASGTSISVTFTAPSNVGGSAITSYRVVATDSSSGAVFTNTGASSPIVVTGLTLGNTYTAKVSAINAFGEGPRSGASNSAIPVAQGQEAYTTAGTYSWVAPAGVTSVSVVAVGGGGGGGRGQSTSPKVEAGGGGALAYLNNYSVTPGSSYAVVVGAGGSGGGGYGGNIGANSHFIGTSTCSAGGGDTYPYVAPYTGTGGGFGGKGGGSGGGYFAGGGGGAGGYSGPGGDGTGDNSGQTGSPYRGASTNTGSGGSGGGGSGNGGGANGAGGGGVGLLGLGSTGTGGGQNSSIGGGGGSGGASGQSGSAGGVGGAYGGGAGTKYQVGDNGAPGAPGAVRIIWPGTTRTFPSTNTADV